MRLLSLFKKIYPSLSFFTYIMEHILIGGHIMIVRGTTPSFTFLLAGAIVTISAAVKVVCEAIERIRKPNKTQDARIAELESKSVKDFNRLNKLEEGNIVTQGGTAGAVGSRNRWEWHRGDEEGKSRADGLSNRTLMIESP